MTVIVHDVEHGVEKVGGFAREVTAKRVAIVAAVTILINLALSYGWINVDLSNEVLKWLSVVFDAATAVGAIAVVRPAVTPVKDPKDNYGNTLVPEYKIEQAVSQVVADAKNAYEKIKSGDVASAANALGEIVGETKQVVTDVRGDVSAVIDPVTEAPHPEPTAPPAPSASSDLPGANVPNP